jgi:hypothetical protein
MSTSFIGGYTAVDHLGIAVCSPQGGIGASGPWRLPWRARPRVDGGKGRRTERRQETGERRLEAGGFGLRPTDSSPHRGRLRFASRENGTGTRASLRSQPRFGGAICEKRGKVANRAGGGLPQVAEAKRLARNGATRQLANVSVFRARGGRRLTCERHAGICQPRGSDVEASPGGQTACERWQGGNARQGVGLCCLRGRRSGTGGAGLARAGKKQPGSAARRLPAAGKGGPVAAS